VGVYICACRYTEFTCGCVYIYVSSHKGHMCVYTFTYMDTEFTCVCVYMYVHTHNGCVCIHLRICTQSLHVYVFIFP